jgi:spore coat-associated protein N
MKKKNKVALLGISGLLASSLAIGGGTYAIFKSGVTNSANIVTAGTLEITAKRDDIPNVGPMFYSQNTAGNYGGMPTGFWAPGDKHTRGLFLENTGSLEAKLTTLTATPADSSGNPVTSGTQYEDDILFARQADVKIWEIQEWDPVEGRLLPLIDTNMNPTEMDELMDILNAGYQIWSDLNPGADLTRQETVAAVTNAVNQYMLEELNKRNNTTDNRLFKVVRMYNKSLNELVNTPFNASSFNIKADVDEAVLLGFTLDFNKKPKNSTGIDKNAMQGKSVFFNFGTDWTQTKNN